MMKYLHEKSNPLLPAVGDVRVVGEISYKDDFHSGIKHPSGRLKIAHCVKIIEHHAIYEFLEDNEQIAVPFEIVEDWGYQSIDGAILHMLTSYMKDILDSSKKYESDTFDLSNGVLEYYKKMACLMSLSRQLLKEADKAKKTYQDFIVSCGKEIKNVHNMA